MSAHAPLRMFRHLLPVGIALSAALAACSSTSPPTTSPAPTESSPGPRPASVEGLIAERAGSVRATSDALLVAVKDDGDFTSARLVVPSLGIDTQIHPHVEPAEEIMNVSFGLVADAPEPTVVAAFEAHRPADGLTPEATTVSVQLIDSDNEVIKTTPTKLDVNSLMNATMSNAAIGGMEKEGSWYRAPTVISLQDGKTSWKPEYEAFGGAGNLLLSPAPTKKKSWDDTPCATVQASDLDTGAKVWSQLPSSWAPELGKVYAGGNTYCHSNVENDIGAVTDAPGNTFIFRTKDSYSHPISRVIGAADGVPIGPGGHTAFVDPINHLTVASGNPVDPDKGQYGSGFSSRGGMTVTDSGTGKEVFSVNGKQGEKLGLTVCGIAGGTIWAKTTDENLMLDARTGETIETGWTQSPIAAGTDWYATADGCHLQGTFEDGPFRNVTLVNHPSSESRPSALMNSE